MDQNKIRTFLQNLDSDWIIGRKTHQLAAFLGEFGSAKSGQQGHYWDHYAELMDPAIMMKP